MLVPAALVKDKLAEAYRLAQFRDLDRMRYYRMDSAASWTFDPLLTNGDWDPLARASMNGDEVLGYCAARFDRQAQNATGFEAWSVRTSPTYVRDLARFAEQVRRSVRWMRFTLAEASPSRPLAERWVRDRGGRVIGIASDYGLDFEGNRWNAVLFEVRGEVP